ncbi:MAG: ThiF family adenylyltransferase, partial [Gammaproteobacteria bacterium]
MNRTHNAEDALRYARQIALPDWGEDGQAKLAAARVMVVGLGGLGSPVVSYLAGAGIGLLTLNDFDQVDLSNLPRQPLHGMGALGESKTQSAARYIEARNPGVRTVQVDRRLSIEELCEHVAQHDVVVDASDNFRTRFDVNTACVRGAVPLVSIAAIRHEGQLAVFDARVTEAPCYACLYQRDDETGEDCVGQGVMTPLVGVMGSLGAIEAIKLLLGQGITSPDTTLHCFD